MDLDKLSRDDIQLLNRVAVRIRKPFVDLIASVSQGLEDNIDWQVGSVASRDPYMSRLFIRCCHLALVAELLPLYRRGAPSGRTLSGLTGPPWGI